MPEISGIPQVPGIPRIPGADGKVPDPNAMANAAAAGAMGSFMGKIGLGKKDGATGDLSLMGAGSTSGFSLAYQQPGKKTTTILSSHLPTIETGSISIFLTNDQTSLSPNEPLTGKIYVNMNEAFDAKALTLSLIGY